MLAYTEKGDGKALVLLHGFCENRHIWDEFTSYLSLSYRVIAIDLPGFGASPLLAETADLYDFADAVLDTLQALDIHQSIMIGHSMGGYTALAFAEKYEDQLIGLGLFNSTAFEDDDAKKETRLKAAEFVMENGSEKFVHSLFPALFTEKARNEFPEKIEALTVQGAKNTKEGIARASLAMRRRKDTTYVLKSVGCPVMFIIGKQDQAVPLEKSVEQCYLPADSHVHFLADVAHMGMVEEPCKTMSIVKNFANYCSEII